ncbi:MAG: thiamine phosphate synthase [Coriobacteriia bacterium]|nr:thiamine phosphate synthase [Coriobacteriia bacterium]
MRNVKPEQLLLYAVTDRTWLHGRSLPDCVRDAIAAGATFVQLREKHASYEEKVALAREIAPICRNAGVPFVIDDDVQVALASGADGVHVGQDDLACAEARRLLGPQAIVGVSAHNVAEAVAAYEQGADYLGSGALVATSTKSDVTPLAPEELARICAAVDIPVVGIGGLNAENIPRFAGLGCAGAAVVSAIFAASDVAESTRELRRVCENTFWRTTNR